LKTVSDDLFRLVKSLTGSEKGFFKKFASRNTPGEKNNYIILFDAVDSMETYDEVFLREKLKKTTFLSQLPVYKNYLFNLILKSMQSYTAYETIDSKISELIQNAKTLEKKLLKKEALKLLKKAKAIAIKYENSKALLEILECERSIVMLTANKYTYDNRVKLYDEQQNLLEMLKRHFYLAWLSDRMVMYVEQRGDFRNEERESEMKRILSDPYLKDKNNLKDYTSKRYYYHINLFNAISKDDLPEMQRFVKKQVDLLNEYKYMIDSSVRSYIHLLVNYLLFSNLVKDKEGVRDAIGKINELKRRLKNKIPLYIEIIIQVDTCYAEIILYRNNGEMKKGRVTAQKIEKLLSEYNNEISLEITVVLLLNTSCFYFIDRNFEAALKIVNRIINDVSPSFKKDQYDFCKLFQLIIHFELSNYNVLENTIDIVYRFMKQRGSIFGIEAAMFKFLKTALRTERNKLKPVYEELLYDLEKSINEPQSRITLGIFNFIMWVKSKLENKSMEELLKSGN